MTEKFRTIALALRDYVSDTYNLLGAADAVVNVLPDLTACERDHAGGWGQREYPADVLVFVALGSEEVLGALPDSKIVAIKNLRGITGCGLKAAKDAVEDPRVVKASTPEPEPTGWFGPDPDEPPF